VGRLALVARDLVEYFAAEFANPPPACLDDIKQRPSRKALFGKRRLRAESRRGSPLKPRFPGAIGKLGAGGSEFSFRCLEVHLHMAELSPDTGHGGKDPRAKWQVVAVRPPRLVPEPLPTPLFSSSAMISRIRTASSSRVASISVVYSSSSSSTDFSESSFFMPYVQRASLPRVANFRQACASSDPRRKGVTHQRRNRSRRSTIRAWSASFLTVRAVWAGRARAPEGAGP
jgi:hypothetical protein